MPEGTDFLYPFLEGDERDAGALLIDLAASAAAKADESARVTAATLAACDDELVSAAAATAASILTGGALFTMGNGGSSTDASALAALFNGPPVGSPMRAACLADDEAVLTALANDVGFDLVFSRQLIALAAAGDVVVGISTSGGSENLLVAFEEAKRRGLLTIGIAGHGGGRFVTCESVDHCFVVESDSVHRVQEAQAVLGFELWARVQSAVGDRRER